MPFVMTKEYRENYYEKNKAKYMKKCICGNCGRELFRGNLRRHQKSHLCKSPDDVNKELEVIPPLVAVKVASASPLLSHVGS